MMMRTDVTLNGVKGAMPAFGPFAALGVTLAPQARPA